MAKIKIHYLLVILAVTVIMRIPTLFEPHWYFDEGIYSLIGSRWFQGTSLYTAIWDHKPPGLFAIYGLSYLMTQITHLDILLWAKLTACLAVVATQLSLYKLTQIFTQKSAPPLIVTAIYGIFSSLPLWEGYMANGEIFMVAFSTWGIYNLLRNTRQDWQRSFWGGVLVGISVLIKPVAIAEAVFGFLLTFSFSRKTSKRKSAIVSYVTGLTLPIAITSLPFIIKGSSHEFFMANLVYNLKYATSNSYPASQDILFNALRIVTIIGIIHLHLRKKSILHLISSWLMLDILAISLSLRPYIHYLLQMFPPLCVLTVITNSKLKLSTAVTSPVTRKWRHPFSALLLGSYLLLLLVPLNQRLNLTNTIPYQFNQFGYFHNFLTWVKGGQTTADYINFFEHGVETNNKIIKFLQDCHLIPRDDFVFIWGGGEAPWLYYELTRMGFKPFTRFTNYFHTESYPGGLNEIAEGIYRQPPGLIIIFPDAPTLPVLRQITKTNYITVREIAGVAILLRN